MRRRRNWRSGCDTTMTIEAEVGARGRGDAVAYHEQLPAVGARPWLHRAWSVQTLAAVDDFIVVPDGCVDVLFSPQTGLQLVGTMSVAQTFALPAAAAVTGVRLRPGAAALWLRCDLSELTDRQVDLAAVLGRSLRRLEARMLEASTAAERRALLSVALSGWLSAAWDGGRPQDRGLLRALAAMDHLGAERVDELAAQCGLSPRQFQRRCLALAGLPPKRLLRVRRVLRALWQHARHGTGWASAAAEAGFADQAHFSRDFTRLIGCSPGRYAQRGGDVRFVQARPANAPVECDP